MSTDRELLRQYAQEGNEAAFGEAVQRHLNMVYGSALRLLNNNAHLAEDVAQTVFIDLARKAAALAQHESVAGWLHTSTRFAAAKALRTEQRRRNREQENYAMSEPPSANEAAWTQLRPYIDEALTQLTAIEREAVLLRYFEERSHREVGAALGLSEGAAQMRVDRAMDKLRAYFVRHGVTATVGLLATTLGTHAAGVTAPAALAANIAGKSLTAAATAGPAAGVWLQRAARAKKPFVLAGSAALAATGILAATYYSLLPQRTTATKAPNAAYPISAKPTSTPAPIMNTSSLLPSAVLAAALLATSATPTTLASAQTVASQLDKSPSTGQTDGNSPSSDVGGGGNQNSPSLSIGANSTTPSAANPAPPGTGIAIWRYNWDYRLDAVNADGSPEYPGYGPGYGYGPGFGFGLLMRADHEPDLVDTSGALNGKTITDIDSWGEQGWWGWSFNGIPYGGAYYGDYSWSALCSDGSVVTCGPAYPPSRDNTPANGPASYTPLLIDTSKLTGKKIATINTGPGGHFILCTDGTIYRYGGWRVGAGKGPDMVPTEPGVRQLDLSTKVTQLSSVGYDTFLAIRRNGTVIGEGTDEFGVLAFGKDPDSTNVGSKVTNIQSVYSGGALKNKTVAIVKMSGAQTLALCTDGTLVHWGYRVVPEMFELGLQADNLPLPREINDIDKMKNAYLRYSDTPVRVLDETGLLAGKSITQIAHVGLRILVLCSDGTVAAWGGEVAPLNVGDSISSYEFGDAGWWRFYYYAAGRGAQNNRVSGPGGTQPDTHYIPRDTSPTASTFSYPVVPDDVAAARAKSTAPNATRAPFYGYWGGWGWGWGYPDLPVTSYPIQVSGVGALANKTVTAITDGGLILCSDNTLAYWDGFEAPKTVNLGPIHGRTILKIAPGMVLFK